MRLEHLYFSKTIFFTFFSRIIASVSGFALNIVIARVLSVEEAGIYFLSFSIITLAVIFSRFGLDKLLLRIIAFRSAIKEWNVVKDCYIRASIISILISLLITISLIYLSSFIAIKIFNKHDLYSSLKMMTYIIPFYTVIFLNSESIKALNFISISLFINFSIIPILTIILIIINLDSVSIDLLIKLFVYANIATCLISIVTWHFISDGRWKLLQQPVCSWIFCLKEGFPILNITLLTKLDTLLPILLLGFFAENAEIALYSIGARVAMLMTLILQAVNSFYSPRFARLYHSGELDQLEKIALHSIATMSLLATPIFIILFIFPEFILEIFGNSYIPAKNILRVLVFGQYVNVITGSVGPLLIMSNYSKKAMVNSLLSVSFSLIFSFILIPIFSITGAAIAFTLALVFKNIRGVFLVNKYLKIKLWRWPSLISVPIGDG